MWRWLVKYILYPAHEYVKGNPTSRILRDMERADSLAAADLQSLTARRLRDFVRYTYEHVPYVGERMRKSGLGPDDIREPADLTRIPLTTKADIRKHRAQLRSRIARNLVQMATGGSTGAPLLFDLSRERIGAAMACRQRVMNWWGLSVGDLEFALWGSPVEVTRQDRLRRLRDKLLRTHLFSAFEMSEAVMSRYLDSLERHKYRTIFAYPSSIYLLCTHARKEGRDLRRLGIKTVFVTGEVLYPDQRELISEALNCPVTNGYGGRESGFVAHECPQGGMHIMADAVIVETVDSNGHAAGPGEPGEIVITDLYSREVPFLRYATGDIGVLSARTCPCGRPLPLLERIEGRTTDFIVAPDGTVLHALSVIYILREIEGVEQFRVRQTAIDRFHVQLVRNERYAGQSEACIREGMRTRLRAPVEVTIEYLQTLPSEPSGKFRQVVSELELKAAPRSRSVVAVGSPLRDALTTND